jgi:hypothetical protein
MQKFSIDREMKKNYLEHIATSEAGIKTNVN